jgi:ubiquitin-protein ligase
MEARIQEEFDLCLNDYSTFMVDFKITILSWIEILFEPKETPYKGGIVCILILVPDKYPQRPPAFHHSKNFHLNLIQNWLPISLFYITGINLNTESVI